MKAIYNDFLQKEKREKLVSVGENSHPVKNFAKKDFLTPVKVARKLGITTQEAKDTMKNLMFKRAIFALNGHKAQIVVTLGKPGAMYLHPMAIDAIKHVLKEQKD